MARPLSYTPEHGPYMTLDDLAEFVAEALAKMPGTTEVRAMGAIEVNFTHGPRITRLTACPEDPT